MKLKANICYSYQFELYSTANKYKFVQRLQLQMGSVTFSIRFCVEKVLAHTSVLANYSFASRFYED